VQQAIRKSTPLARSPLKSGGVEVSKGVEIELEEIGGEEWQLVGCLDEIDGFWAREGGGGPSLSKIL